MSAGPRRTVLVADDDAVIRALVRKTLAGGYSVVEARDGVEAFELARRSPPDLFILDVNMPGKSGDELARELRACRATRIIPIVFLTGNTGLQDKLRGFQSGADDYITKPFDVFELVARVEAVLRRNAEALSSSPLTMLPGNLSIEREASRRIEAGEPFALLYVDIDRFKAYNDGYGHAKGNILIQRTARIITDAVESEGARTDFVGHVGGDDFVVLASPAAARVIGERIASGFDKAAKALCRPGKRSGPGGRGRRGDPPKPVPAPSVSVAIVSSGGSGLGSYAALSEAVSLVKMRLKCRQPGEGSAVSS
ncbi:MAG: response regulator [Elusimicrobia bacterium]|nr:response regulator [Elusimicrobiota bacterium]